MNNHTQGQGGRFSRTGRRLLLAGFVVLLGLAGLYVAVRRVSVKRRLAALRAEGYPTSFAELARYKELAPGAENAAGLYLGAFKAYVPPVDDANLPILGTAELPQRGTPLPEPMAEAISGLLASNRACLALLRQAGGIEHCRYDWVYGDYAAGLPVPREIRSCVRLLDLAAISHADKGDTGAAAACLKDALRLGDSLRREPGLFSYLVRMACHTISLKELERTLSVANFTDEQLRQMSETLATISANLDFTEVMVTERAFMIEWCKDPSLLTGLGRGGTLLKVPGIRKVGLHDALDYMADCIEAAALPSTQRLARFREIGEELEELSFFHVMVRMVAPALTRVAEFDLRIRAHLDMAQTALAIERYRLVNGKVPETLETLVPDFLDEVQIDPFNGRPIRYKRTEPGYVLYSILEDGEDNGGLEDSKAGRRKPYDLCFIVAQ